MSNNLEYKLTLKDLFTKTMLGAEKSARRLDERMSSIQSGLGKIGLGIGIAAFGKSILETGSMFERAEIQLTTLLKSSSKAKAVFNDIKQESTKSPFGFETLLQGNAALISAGLSASKAKEDVNSLGNAIAATGGTEDTFLRMIFNLQQIKNLGKASAADIKQFGMANIDIYGSLNDYYVKNKIALKDQSASYEQITGALKLAASTGGRYFGAMDNLANSTSGRLSNLSDAFKNFLNELFIKGKSVINTTVVLLTKLMDVTVKLLPVIKTGIILWGSYYLKVKLSAMASNSFAIANRAMAMGMTKSQIASVYLSRGIKGIGAAIKSVPIIGWVLALADGFMYLWDNVEGFRASIMGIVEVFKNYFSPLIEMISALMSGDFEKMKKASVDWVMGNKPMSEKDAWTSGRVKGFESFKADKLAENGGLDKLDTIGASSKLKGDGGLGTGTEVMGNAPKNLTININKLVEELNVNTTNLQESSAMVKEAVSKALLEAVNDINMMER